MAKVPVKEKATAISKSLGEPEWLLEVRLAAAAALEKKGKEEVEDFSASGGKGLSEWHASEELRRALSHPLFGREHESYLLPLALFTEGSFISFSGARQIGVRAATAGAPYSLDVAYFAPDCEAGVLFESQADAMQSNGVLAFLDRGARADLCLFQNNGWETKGETGLSARLQEGSALKLLRCNVGGLEQHDSMLIVQEGRKSSCENYEVSLLQGNQRLKKESDHLHIAPDTYSRSIFKYATSGTSHASVEGEVTIEQSAPGSDTHLLAKSLLLSEKSHSHVVPQLFVRNADVAAGHGSSLTPLQDEELFYLRSRGIGENEAKLLVLGGFLDETFQKCGMAPELLSHARAGLDAEAEKLFPRD